MKRLIIPLALLLLTALQNSLFVHIKVLGVYPDILLTFIICFALVRGNPWGIVVGIGGGILEDIFFRGAFGINSIACMLTAFLVGTLESKIYKDNYIVPLVFTFAGTVVKELIVYLFLYLTRSSFDISTAVMSIIIPEAIYNSLLAVLFFRYVIKLTDKYIAKQTWLS